MAVQIPKASFTDMTEKIVRGLVYREDGAFIEAPYKIEIYIVDDEGAKVCKEMLDKAGKVFKREPGPEIRRAPVDGDEPAGLYEITFWQQFKTYATVSKADLSKFDELSSLTGSPRHAHPRARARFATAQTTDRNAARPDASGLRLRRRRMRWSSGASRLRFCVCQRSLQALEQYTALLLRPWIGWLHSRHTPMYITPLHTVATVER
jgi:hypothetical protein